MTSDGNTLLLGRNDGIVTVWDLNLGTELSKVKLDAGTIDCMAVSKEGKNVAISCNGTVHICKTSKRE
jgi:WD40 repeat protein